MVKPGELERNVKLGRGGIREVEFIVQTLQLLHAGRMPFLQGAGTVPILEKLASYRLLSAEDAASLTGAYLFLRDVEHRLQMEAGQQTHTIPTARQARERLARLMGFASLPAFESAHQAHTRQVRRLYEKVLGAGEPARASELPGDFAGDEAAWKEFLARHHFRDVDRALRMVEMFMHGPGFVHVSARTTELARELLPRFFALCPPQPGPTTGGKPRLSDPDRVLVRLQSFMEAYGARAMLCELWTQKPSLFELLLLLFDRSEFLAESAIRTPDLVDELEAGGRLRRQKTAGETLHDLRHGLGRPGPVPLAAPLSRGRIDAHRPARHFGPRRFRAKPPANFPPWPPPACNTPWKWYAARQRPVRRALLHHRPGQIGRRRSRLRLGPGRSFCGAAPAPKNLPACQRLAAGVMDLLSRPTGIGIRFSY